MAFDGQNHMYVAQRGGIKASYDYSQFAEAKQSIEDQLLQDKRNKLMEDWVAQIRQKYASQIAYAVGFEPAAAATTTTTTP